jgi:type I restriction enzyme R subunit
MEAAGYSAANAVRVNQQRDYYLNVRNIVRQASGESLDLKPFEADMRHLIDTYIEASEARVFSPFVNMSLLDVIAKIGIAKAIDAELGVMKGNHDAVAETIENNVRKKIIKDRLTDPLYFETMSALLDEVIAARKAKAIEYEEYLRRVAEIAEKVDVGHSDDTPTKLDTAAKRALWNNLGRNEESALAVDALVRQKRPDGWRGVHAREQTVKGAIYEALLGKVPDDELLPEVERVFLIVKAQDEY